MCDFDLIPDTRGLFVDVKYPHEDRARYTIDLITMECVCKGYTMEQAKAAKENRKPKNCKHLEEVRFRLHNAGIKLGRVIVKENIL